MGTDASDFAGPSAWEVCGAARVLPAESV